MFAGSGGDGVGGLVAPGGTGAGSDGTFDEMRDVWRERDVA